MKKYHIVILCFTLLTLIVSHAKPAAADDCFIKGYAAAILEQIYNLSPAMLDVSNGTIIITTENIERADRETITNTLSNIRGVIQVKMLDTGDNKTVEATESDVAAPEESLNEQSEGNKSAVEGTPPITRRLFEPLIADPRWPHFSIAFQYYIDDEELRNVGATSFGETLPLYKNTAPFGGHWELGIQAAVFAIFDLDADSMDLINADYWVGIPVSYRIGDLSGIFRIFHQSSHIGDEYLLRSRIDRVNLSYESVDLKLSYDVLDWIRIYCGGGYLIRKDPEDLKPWSTQFGFELKSRRTYLNNRIRPLLGSDFKSKEEISWRTDVSLRGGVQLNIKRDEDLYYRMQFMLEYFNGNSPNGQFYERMLEYVSLGTHFYF